MKANEAPEKIYITNYDIPALPKEEQLSERWHEVSTQDTDIEYTRTDAFVEKACEWIREFNNHHYIMRYSDSCEPPLSELTEWFKNYMKGE